MILGITFQDHVRYYLIYRIWKKITLMMPVFWPLENGRIQVRKVDFN